MRRARSGWTRYDDPQNILPPALWPRWALVDLEDEVPMLPSAIASTILTPDVDVYAQWHYGAWLTHLAKHGGVFTRRQWNEGFGKDADTAWKELLNLRIIQEGVLADGETGKMVKASYGWLTRAGWHVVRVYDVPRRVPSYPRFSSRLTHGLMWLELAQHTLGVPGPWTNSLTTAPARLPYTINWHGVPEGVVHSLARKEPARDRRVPAKARRRDDLTFRSRIAFSLGKPEGRPTLYAADALNTISLPAMRTWITSLSSRRASWPEPWKSAPLVILVPGNDRAAFWYANRATWRANLWGTDLQIQNLHIEETVGMPLIGGKDVRQREGMEQP